MKLRSDAIPAELRQLPRWVAWKLESRNGNGKTTKVPYGISGRKAKADDASTWADFDAALRFAQERGMSGVGFQFGDDGPYAGIDLDGCRRPDGTIEPWAKAIIDRFSTYTEISPSGTGVKLYLRGRLDIPNTGRSVTVAQQSTSPDKNAAIEMFQSRRFFCVTGEHLPGTPTTVEHRQAELEAFYSEFFSAPPAPAVQQALPPPDHRDRRGRPTDTLAAIEALHRLNAAIADDYDLWLRVGMALHSIDTSPIMLATWDAWSRQSAKYEAGACTAKWSGFHAEGNGKKLGIGTLLQLATEQVEWEQPRELGAINVASFPVEAFEADLRDYVFAVSESLQVPTDMVATCMLAMFAIALAHKVEVHVRGDHTEPVNIYVLNVSNSGERKSATCRELRGPLDGFERSENAGLAKDIALYDSRIRTLQKKLSTAENKAASKEGLERQSAERERDELVMQIALEEEAAPRALRLTVGSDCTPERLVGILAEQKGRLGLLDTEGGLFSLMRGRYSANGEANVDAYLKAHSGDDIRIDRVKRAADHVENPALTIALFAQPEILRGLLRERTLRGVGLLARFFYVLPPSMVGWRRMTPDPIDVVVRDAYRFRMRRALDLEPEKNEDGRNVPRKLHLTPEALAVWLAAAERIETALRPDGALAYLKDWGAKLAGGVARIAGLLHMLDYDPHTPISGDTMHRAALIGECFQSHALAAFAEMGADADTDLAREIDAWVRQAGLRQFTKREAHRRFSGRGDIKKADDLDGALGLLQEAGRIRDATRTGQRGRPSATYLVNPGVFE